MLLGETKQDYNSAFSVSSSAMRRVLALSSETAYLICPKLAPTSPAKAGRVDLRRLHETTNTYTLFSLRGNFLCNGSICKATAHERGCNFDA
jgi:hypothetical protein